MLRSLTRATLGLAATLLVVGCNDDAPTNLHRPPAIRSFAMSDGSSGGNPHFFFLEPIVTNATPAGQFNASLSPTLEICDGIATSNGHCASLLASFTMQNGISIPLDASGQPKGFYLTEWRAGAIAAQTYRLIVLLGDFVAGFADVTKAADGSWRDSNGRELNAGAAVLPIRFRLENGVICGDQVECLETTVTPAGGTFTLNDSTAGASFPVNAVSQNVNLIIEQVSGPCLPTTLSQFPECFHYSTEPALTAFNDSVTVGFCMTDPAGWNFLQDGQLRLWKWSENNGDPLVELARTTVDFLNCPDLSGQTQSMHSPLLRGLARAGSLMWLPFSKLLGVEDAYAIGLYEGGKLSNFSRIGWVRPLALQIQSGDNQQGFTGGTLPDDPTVRVVNRYGNTTEAVSGRTVGFTSAPSGTAQPASVVSDAFGLASTNWTLGTAPGIYSLTALVNTSLPIAPAPYEPTAIFHAQAVQPFNIKWLPPVTGSSKQAVTKVPGLQVVVLITQGTNTLAQIPAVEGLEFYQATWSISPPLAPTTIRAAVLVSGVQMGYVDMIVDADGNLRNVSTGEKILNLKNSRSLPMKFILYR